MAHPIAQTTDAARRAMPAPAGLATTAASAPAAHRAFARKMAPVAAVTNAHKSANRVDLAAAAKATAPPIAATSTGVHPIVAHARTTDARLPATWEMATDGP